MTLYRQTKTEENNPQSPPPAAQPQAEKPAPAAPVQPAPLQGEKLTPAATTTASGTTTTARTQAPGPGFDMLIMFGIMFLIMWFLVFRPQRKQKKEREQLLNNLKKNDHVLTSGGIYGIIQSVKDNEVTLKVDEQSNIRLRVSRQAIVHVEQRAGEEETK